MEIHGSKIIMFLTVIRVTKTVNKRRMPTTYTILFKNKHDKRILYGYPCSHNNNIR